MGDDLETTWLDLLIKLNPLLVAPLHGYLAAWLMVQLIFRPYKPIYLLGYRLPFTPGLLPKEKTRLVDAVSRLVAERLLTVELITDELMQLGLEAEIEMIARQQYYATSQRADVLDSVVLHLRQSLERLRDNAQVKQQLALQLQDIIEREMLSYYGVLRRTVAGLFIDMTFVQQVVNAAMEELVDQIEASLYVRQTIESTLTHLPETVFKNDQSPSGLILAKLVATLSQRLNLYELLKRRLDSLSAETLEMMVRATAGREIRAMIWLGTGLGLVVGLVQTGLNFLA